MADDPWYRDGLRFECTGCGDCCTGAPGFVWVNRAEIEALAERLGLAPVEFEERFVRKVGVRRSLVEHSNGDCVFFDGATRRCTVYEQRPRQCRTWPFWESNVATPEDWADTCRACPGSGRGQLFTVEQIAASVAVIRV